jgi:hypothetical protein
MRRLRHLAPTGLLFGAELAGVFALVRLGHVDGFSVPFAHVGLWLRQSPPADVLAATLRLVALGGLCWLFASTVLYGFARVVRATRVINALGWCTLPAIRRVVDGALAVSLVTTGVVASGAGLAHAAPPPPPPTTSTTSPHVRSGRAHVLESFPPAPTSPSSPAQQQPPPASSPPDPPTPTPPPAPVPDAQAQRHVVVAGDNLWTIAAGEVARATGRSESELTDQEIARYWVELLTAARPGLRSGNPNLIYPGEVVPLPPITGRAAAPTPAPR